MYNFEDVERKMYIDMLKLASVTQTKYFDTYYQNILISDIEVDKVTFKKNMNDNEGNEIYVYCVISYDMFYKNTLKNIVKYIHRVISLTCEYINQEV